MQSQLGEEGVMWDHDGWFVGHPFEEDKAGVG